MDKMEDRLKHLYNELLEVISFTKPELVAIEDQYFQRNMTTLKSLSQARGVAMLAASQFDIPIEIISPTTAKKAITGNGRSNKKKVRQAVSSIFDAQDLSFDEADAVAIAYAAYLQTQRTDAL